VVGKQLNQPNPLCFDLLRLFRISIVNNSLSSQSHIGCGTAWREVLIAGFWQRRCRPGGRSAQVSERCCTSVRLIDWVTLVEGNVD
jgi:hypothetical protein